MQLQTFVLTVLLLSVGSRSDGRKFKAVNNRDRNFTSAKLQRRMADIESSIQRYLTELDTADREELEIAQAKSGRLNHKIANLRAQMQRLKEIETVPAEVRQNIVGKRVLLTPARDSTNPALISLARWAPRFPSVINNGYVTVKCWSMLKSSESTR